MQFWPMVGGLAKGLGTTTSIFALTLLFSLPLGLLISLGRMSKVGVLRQAMRFYISVMRGTPLMLQLFFFYFGPYYIFNLNLGRLGFWGLDYRFIAVILGFSLNYAAYFAEIYRAGIESIPVGQREAGKILGFSRAQTFFRIILPQVVKRILPPVTNEVITLVKDTSLAFALSVMEMFTIAKMEAAAHTTMVPFMVAGLFYYVFNFVVAAGMEWFEKRLDYYK
jgi:polar amino acid transport system permease protein